MALERKNPIPAGRYWIDPVGPRAKERFDSWVLAHPASIEVESSEEETTPVEPYWQWFIIFRVTAATPRWEPIQGLGAFPNVAPASVKQKTDVEPRPKVPDAMQTLKDAIETALSSTGTVLLLGIVAYTLFTKRS